MKNVTDIHMHVVPGVDDGSRSLGESVELLRLTAAEGVEVVFATPHSFAFEFDPDFVRRSFGRLEQQALELCLPVRLYLGCEVLVCPATVDRCVRDLITGKYPTMNGTRYVLTEFDPYGTAQRDAEFCVGRIVSAGYLPIIAHAERYPFTSVTGIRTLREAGALVQINAYSIADEHAAWIRENAHGLLAGRLVDFLGSDTHRLDHRPPHFAKGMAAFIRQYSEDYAAQIAVHNPRQLLLGEDPG